MQTYCVEKETYTAEHHKENSVRDVIVSIPKVHMSYITVAVDDDDDDQAIKEKANLLLE